MGYIREGPFYRCPECGKKGVKACQHSDGDGFGCRYCSFWAYTPHTHDRMDTCYRFALAQVNPDVNPKEFFAPETKPEWPSYLSSPEPWLAPHVTYEPEEK